MKLRFFLKNNEKVYTMKEEASETKEKTKPAHYKFVKIRDAPKSNIKFVRRN